MKGLAFRRCLFIASRPAAKIVCSKDERFGNVLRLAETLGDANFRKL